MRAVTVLWLLTVSIAAGQQVPTSACDFDGFDINSKLGEVAQQTTAYYGCTVAKKCLSMTLKAGDPLVINRVEGDWTCGYLTARKGSAQGWIHSHDVRLAESDPNPTLTAWVGTWVQGENRITIRLSETSSKLSLEGEAYWHGIGDNVHTGSFSGEATPAGGHLHYSEGDNGACTADLALWGKYILTNDNSECGGMNVRFWGIWKRARLQDPLK